ALGGPGGRRWCRSVAMGDRVPRFLQGNGYLLNDFNDEALQSSNPLRPVREQADPPEVEIGQYLRADADFALDLLRVVVEKRKSAATMEAQCGAVTNFLDRKSLRGLMQVDQRPQ